ncbi:MAG: SCO family protein [Planctomycetaceae bacterium]
MIERILSFLAGDLGDPQPRGPRRVDRFANVPMTNQFGKQIRFVDDLVAGKALIVNTMYSRCRGTCPGTSATLESLRTTLSPIFGQNLSMVSFTLEPEYDTPEVLARYAKIYGAGKRVDHLCDWHFLSGTPENTRILRYSLDFYDLDPRIDSDVTEHDALLLFGNETTDRWAVLPAELREPLLIETIRRVAGTTIEQRYGIAESARS